MGIAQSFERRLEQFVEGFFARTFRSGLQPVELGRKLLREMERGKTLTNSGVVVANHFRVALAEQDAERFSHFQDSLRAELVSGLTEECSREGWRTLGPVQVEFLVDDHLKLGRFVIESRILEGPMPATPPASASVTAPRPAAPPPEAVLAPPTGSNPRLEAPDGTVVHLADGTFRVGRLDDCAIRFEDPNVSRHHAEIHGSGGTFEVVDLGSTNGTYVNGARIAAPTPLRHGDRVAFGRNNLTFLM